MIKTVKYILQYWKANKNYQKGKKAENKPYNLCMIYFGPVN